MNLLMVLPSILEICKNVTFSGAPERLREHIDRSIAQYAGIRIMTANKKETASGLH